MTKVRGQRRIRQIESDKLAATTLENMNLRADAKRLQDALRIALALLEYLPLAWVPPDLREEYPAKLAELRKLAGMEPPQQGA